MNKSNHKSKYTSEIVEFIRSNVKQHTDREIAELLNQKWSLNLNIRHVKYIKERHGIKTGFGRGFFVKGQQSWNKGKKTITVGRMAETQFKKGGFSFNRVPIGTERVNSEGYHEVKVQDGQKQHNWVLKHRLIWEQHNGPIPPKHRIVFLDSNRNNLDISNLELMSFEQTAVMSKRKLFYKDPELTKIGSKIAEIELRVNKKKRGNTSV